MRMPDSIDGMMEAPKDYRFVKMKFPAADIMTLRLATPTSPVITMEKCAFTYAGREKAVVENVTLSVTMQSRIGIIGRNGKGKTTLLQALFDCLDLTATTATGANHTAATKKSSISVYRAPNSTPATASTTTAAGKPSSKSTTTTSASNTSHAGRVELIAGTLWKHHNVKIGIVNQHQIDLLSQYLFHTPMTYLQYLISTNPNTSTPTAETSTKGIPKTELDFRAHLGSFGLSGPLALQQIGSLSGGQKARLSFAATCLFHPHVLLLDEPSNHLSMDAIDALITAARDFSGALIVISHNRFLLSRVCKELWTVQNNTVVVRRPVLTATAGGSGSNNNNAGAGAGSGAGGGDAAEQESAFNRLLEECIREQINQ
jgi:ATPase subunit of ABC transporter with duplicated ATPase domains